MLLLALALNVYLLYSYSENYIYDGRAAGVAVNAGGKGCIIGDLSTQTLNTPSLCHFNSLSLLNSIFSSLSMTL